MRTPSKVDLILHRVRLRVIQVLAPDLRLTIGEIAERLRDVPQATLYRHVNRLIEGGVIRPVEERRSGGAVERVYQIAAFASMLAPKEMARASRDEHMRYFATFVATLLADYARYLEREKIDLQRDGVGYRQVPLNLTDDEFLRFASALNAAVVPFLSIQPAPNRTRRVFSTIMIPSVPLHK